LKGISGTFVCFTNFIHASKVFAIFTDSVDFNFSIRLIIEISLSATLVQNKGQRCGKSSALFT